MVQVEGVRGPQNRTQHIFTPFYGEPFQKILRSISPFKGTPNFEETPHILRRELLILPEGPKDLAPLWDSLQNIRVVVKIMVLFGVPILMNGT